MGPVAHIYLSVCSSLRKEKRGPLPHPGTPTLGICVNHEDLKECESYDCSNALFPFVLMHLSHMELIWKHIAEGCNRNRILKS